MKKSDAHIKGDWHQSTLGEHLKIIRGVTYKKQYAVLEPREDFVPILRATNIQNGIDFSDFVYVPKRFVSEDQMLQKDDIIIAASSGSRNIVGKAAQLEQEWQGSFGAFCYCLRPIGEINKKFPAWFLQTAEYRNLVSKLSAGVNINNLRAEHIRQIPFRYPHNYEDQQEIVSEIEKQFTRLEKGVSALKRVQANLKRYRASVLKAACEGRLVPTEAELARKEDRSYEPADVLLQRILEERRKNWQGRGKYKEPASPNTSNLPPLPEGWCWVTAEQICEFITKGTTPLAGKMNKSEGSVPFIKVHNLTFTGGLNLNHNPTFINRETHMRELARSHVIPGDILINIVGPPLGQVSLVPDTLSEANINQAIARFRPVLKNSRNYIACCLMAESLMSWAKSRAKATAGQHNLTLQICRELPIPFPPLAEQIRIVSEVGRCLSIIEELEAVVHGNFQRATRLRQSILQQAFDGNLMSDTMEA